METPKENITETLNDLIIINNDRIEGYGRAVKEAEENDLKSLFKDMASHSRQFKSELTSELQKQSGQVKEGTKTSGKVFRVWMDMKAAATGNNRKTILSSCERGEDAALEAYNDALHKDETLPSPLRTTIERQKRQLQEDHDAIKKLRDSVKA